MKKILFFAMLALSFNVFALDFTISFTGSGASSIVGDVLVQNLSKGTSVTVPAGNVLNLNDSPTLVIQQSATRDGIFVYQDAKDGTSRVSFYSKQAGLTQLNAYGIDGRKLIGINQHLPVGEITFQLSLSKGAYIIQVVGNGYAYSAKLISPSSSQTLPAIEYAGSQFVSSSALQKSKSAVNGITSMLYFVGDQLLYTAVSGNYSSIVTDKPTQDKTTNFNFVACKDADQNNYKTVSIGAQTWMVENLKTTKYRNGESIVNVSVGTSWSALSTGAWCNYNNDAAYDTKYGKLYNWYAINDNRNIAPIGWHVPYDAEWTTLSNYLGGTTITGSKLMETGTVNWAATNTKATNETGFTALGGGIRYTDGTFTGLNNWGNWWSSTSDNLSSSINRTVYSGDNQFWVGSANKLFGVSIRCLKDTASLPTLNTTAISSISSTTASGGGNITSDGGAPVLARGVCWSTTPNPTVAFPTKTSDGSGISAFTSSITGLTPSTTYYVRAYATNSMDTAYGNEVTFTTSAQNLLANPSFETWSAGVPTGWTLTSTVGGSVTQSASTSTANGSAFQIANPTGTYIIQQNIVPPAGASTFDTNITYKLSVSYLVTAGDGTDARIWSGFVTSAAGVTPLTYYAVPATHADSLLYYIPIHGPGGNVSPPTGVFGNDANGYLLDNRSSGTWNTYSYSFKFPAGIKQFNFAVRSYAASTVIWDDFFFGESSKSLAPTISSTDATDITTSSATSGGNISNNGGSSVTARGVCWSTSPAPTVALTTKTSDGSGIGAFTSSITGLIPNTTYYVRAYATNSVDTSYGNEVFFTTNAQNLLANPSFETWSAGAPTDWLLTSTVGGTVTQCATTSTGSGNSFQIANPTSTYIIQQNINPPAGASTFDTNITYKLSVSYLVTAGDGTDARFWSGLVSYVVPPTHADSLLYYIPLHGPGGSVSPPTGVFGNDANGYLLDNRSSGTWHTYSYSFKFPAGIKQFNFAVRTYTASTVIWDDFFFGESSNAPITITKPTLTTINLVTLTSNTASSGGNISNNGGADVTERGVCWSTSPGPTNMLTTKTSDGSGMGTFTSTLTGLMPGIIYYVRAYATNSAGTAFGNEVIYTPVIVSNKILFDNTKAEQAGNADWVISNSANPTQFPTPDQSGISATTPETFWEGGISSWGIDCVKEGYAVETLPVGGQITYGDLTNVQDLSKYKVYVICEPNILFTDLEKTAILNFVKNGGGLFMVSDHTVSDRNNDGWDSPAIWNDLLTNNSVEANPFGISFDLVNIVQSTTNMATLASDSILHGKMGDVTEAAWFNGTTMTLTPSKNPKVVGQVFTTGSSTTGTTNVMFATSKYGKGKVAAIGDSSPCDDGTGGIGNTLYNGYWTDALGNHRKLLMNATIWLAY